jgi:hypothetical protein
MLKSPIALLPEAMTACDILYLKRCWMLSAKDIISVIIS